MAEEALEKLKEQLNCSICLDTYTNPRQLQCHHVYCQNCLKPLVLRDQGGNLAVPCPTCRQSTSIPPGGVSGLQSAFHIHHLLEIRDSLEKAFGGGKEVQCCSVHAEEEVKLYCETCVDLICFHCIMKTGQHHSHNYELISNAFVKYKEQMELLLKPMQEQLISIDESLAQLQLHCGEISDREVIVEADVRCAIKQLHQILEVREDELIQQLQGITRTKLGHLSAQITQVQTTQMQLKSCVDFVTENLEADNQGELILMMKTTMLQEVKELATSFQPDILTTHTKADVEFFASAGVTSLCQKYGLVSTPTSPDPSQCHLMGVNAETAVMEVSIGVLHVVNFRGEPCKEPIKLLECELVCDNRSCDGSSCGPNREQA